MRRARRAKTPMAMPAMAPGERGLDEESFAEEVELRGGIAMMSSFALASKRVWERWNWDRS